MPKVQNGSCLCGQVTYHISGPLRAVVNCHCQQCRKSSGHHVAATSALRSDIEIEGEVTWFVSSPGIRRGFCATCGANLFWSKDSAARLSIFAGTLNGTTGLTTKGNIFVADKGDYYEVDDRLPCADGSAPDLTTV